MKISFTYNREKDIWCLLNKGPSSINSPTPTKQYDQLVAEYGPGPTGEMAGKFIEQYLAKNKIDVQEYAEKFRQEWAGIAAEYQKRAEAIFGVSLPADITAYLTINGRCPYNIEHNYFYVSMRPLSAGKIAMHELWHFYTWYGLGAEQEEKLGRQKYNDLKEAFTVLLNAECRDLFPAGAEDGGYPQHKALREKILLYWGKDRNIHNLWSYLINL
ncbi:MAG TPA: hypothetical protein VHA30_03250 [Patescibacteria group bacterium]|nr:hypothetical protein [Patescibacteria group bacterium]